MPGLSNELYNRCRTTLLKCSEFDSDASLRAVFVTNELRPFRSGLPEAASRNERVAKCLDYLLEQGIKDSRPVLPLFLVALRDRYHPGIALRDELEALVERIQGDLSLSLTSRRQSDVGSKLNAIGQLQQSRAAAPDKLMPSYLVSIDEDIDQFVNKITRYLMKTKRASNADSLAPAHLWFVRRQEIWETLHAAISQLQDDLDTVTGSDLETIMEASTSFDYLMIEASGMFELLETVDEGLPSGRPRAHLRNDLLRIKELASATANQLAVIADQVSWGEPTEQSAAQVRRNLLPLNQLMSNSLQWLNLMVSWLGKMEPGVI